MFKIHSYWCWAEWRPLMKQMDQISDRTRLRFDWISSPPLVKIVYYTPRIEGEVLRTWARTVTSPVSRGANACVVRKTTFDPRECNLFCVCDVLKGTFIRRSQVLQSSGLRKIVFADLASLDYKSLLSQQVTWRDNVTSVSYTHLTLPTIYSV